MPRQADPGNEIGRRATERWRAGLRAAAQAGQNRVIVVEDHWIEGGLGDAVLEVFAESGSVRVRKLAVCELPHSGKPEELLDLYGLSARKIAQAVRAFCK